MQMAYPPPTHAGNIIGCAIGVTLLLNCGLVPLFQNGINAISAGKIAYPLKEVCVHVCVVWCGSASSGCRRRCGA